MPQLLLQRQHSLLVEVAVVQLKSADSQQQLHLLLQQQQQAQQQLQASRRAKTCCGCGVSQTTHKLDSWRETGVGAHHTSHCTTRFERIDFERFTRRPKQRFVLCCLSHHLRQELSCVSHTQTIGSRKTPIF